MTPEQQGFVFSMLLRYREIASRPIGRPSHPDEARAAQILADSLPQQLEDFDLFLGAQGFGLNILDGFADLGIPPVAGRVSDFYILVRRYGEQISPILNTLQFADDFRDRRKERSDKRLEHIERLKSTTIFWCARLWLTLQYFFYERIDRPVGNLTQWRNALVSEAGFVRMVTESIEALGNSGRPDGEAGVLWDAYWEGRSEASGAAIRFLKLMFRYGMLEKTDTEGIYQQSLVAAVDMRLVSDQSLRYLTPSPTAEVFNQTRSMLNGYAAEPMSVVTNDQGVI